jgi:hypothetical protein
MKIFSQKSPGKDVSMRTWKLMTTLALASALPMWAQGSKYGSRDPKTCPASKYSAAPSTDQAGQLFACATEQDTGDTIYLVQDVKVEIASKSRSFQSGDLYNDIDQSGPVFPIRGSYTEYACRKQFNLDSSHTNLGKNCSAMQQPHAQGICYKTTFGDWSCRMRDPSVHWDTAVANLPPPK